MRCGGEQSGLREPRGHQSSTSVLRQFPKARENTNGKRFGRMSKSWPGELGISQVGGETSLSQSCDTKSLLYFASAPQRPSKPAPQPSDLEVLLKSQGLLTSLRMKAHNKQEGSCGGQPSSGQEETPRPYPHPGGHLTRRAPPLPALVPPRPAPAPPRLHLYREADQ